MPRLTPHLFIYLFVGAGGWVQDIEKRNKKLKGSEPLLQLRRLNFERVRSLWTAKKGTWLAVDFEDWEYDHTVVLEFGFSYVRWDGEGGEDTRWGHWIVKENRKYLNYQYVKGNRDVRSARLLLPRMQSELI